MSRVLTFLSAAVLTVLASVSSALADSGAHRLDSASRINAANALLREGKIDEAIEGYRQVQSTGVHRDQVNYNLAVAEFRKGEIESALALFTEAAASSDAAVASRSRYNLGNCFYSEALQQSEQDKTAAIASLREAISHYRGALRGDPNNTDARANIELAGELLRRLQEEQKQAQKEQEQKQQQNQDHNQSDQQNSDQQQQAEQNDESDQSNSQNSDAKDNKQQQSNGQEKSDAQNQPDQQNQSDEAKSNEQQSEQSQEDQSDSQTSDGNQSKADESKAEPDKNKGGDSGDGSSDDQSEQQRSEQQTPSKQDSSSKPSSSPSRPKDMQSPDGGQPQPREESDDAKQEIPSGELTAAGEQDASGKPAGAAAMADPNAQDGVMSKEEALKMLQAVRDRDMLRRLRQEQLERSRHVPVDRDW